MTTTFSVGDHVRWNSEAGQVTGTATKVPTRDVEFLAMHKGDALSKG